jgi:hypothetical protein
MIRSSKEEDHLEERNVEILLYWQIEFKTIVFMNKGQGTIESIINFLAD